jgi:hypothetical protein
MGEVRPDRDGWRASMRTVMVIKNALPSVASMYAALMPMNNPAVIMQEYDADLSAGNGALAVWVRA